jgi:uncharacterized protein (DUF427 family)
VAPSGIELGIEQQKILVCNRNLQKLSFARSTKMKATLSGRIIAESDDVVANGGYQYFPSSAVRLDWLDKVPKTESDRACPHGVQFYDVVIDGVRYARAAWVYEAPRASKIEIAGRFGFWQDVEVA